MARKPSAAHKEDPKLYIGEWLSRLGRRPGEVARAVDIGESHLSLIISGKVSTPGAKPKRPSYSLLFDIADELGITVDDLRHPPPRDEAVQSVQRLSQKAQEALLRRQ